MTLTLPERVTLVEVGPRDGFQAESSFIPTELKIRVIDLLADAGVTKIEATSFVSPKAIPQTRDAAEVMSGITRKPGVTFTALVPNLKGADRALEAEVDTVVQVIASTDAYNRKNLGRSIDESFDDLRLVVDRAHAAGRHAEVIFGLGFGCPLTGSVPEHVVLGHARRAADIGVDAITVADSFGFAHPEQAASMARALRSALSLTALGFHLHDTRGLALANVLAAMTSGVTTFDASIGGLGGLPNVVGSTGNLASEELVYLCEEMGVRTGVDLDKLMDATRVVREFLGRELPSRVLASGTRAALFARIAARNAQSPAS